MSKNLMIAYFPEDDGGEDDSGDFLEKAQADEPGIHQPGLGITTEKHFNEEKGRV